MTQHSEQAALAEVQQRLSLEFPHAAPEAVGAAVQSALVRFESSRIRDYVPLFVEKDARRQLGH